MGKKGGRTAKEQSMCRQRQEEMEGCVRVRELVHDLLRHMGWMMSLSIILMAVFGAYSWWCVPPVYEATAKLYAVEAGESMIDLSDLQLGSYLTADYQEVFKTWEVNEQVVERLSLNCTGEELREQVKVSNPGNSRVLYITCRWADPVTAADIANEYASVAQDYIEGVMAADKPRVFSMAKASGKPVGAGVAVHAALGAASGWVLAGLVLLAHGMWSDRVRATEHGCEVAGMPLLAVIPDLRQLSSADRDADSRR